MFLVTGATGALGKRIIRDLREGDRACRAFVRLTSRYGELEQRGAEIFIGDLSQERDIRKACQGVRYVISTHGADAENSSVQALDYRANVDLIDAAKEASVEHFVFISVLGADRGYEDAPIFKAKREVEKYLSASGLNYTILRPSGLASDLVPLAERFCETGIFLAVGDLKNRSSPVSPDDLAKMAIASVEVEGAQNQIFPVGGPDVIKREDLPRIFARLCDREPFVLNPPLTLVDGLRGAIGLVNPDLQASLGTFRTILANEFFCTPEEIKQIETTFALELESLENFLRRYIGSQS